MSTQRSSTTAVCFDLDGTLLHFTTPYSEIVADAFDAHLDQADPAWCERYNECFFAHFRALDPDPYRRAMEDVCATFDLAIEPTTLAETLLDREFAATAVDDAAVALLERLAHHHPLGVVTNGVSHVQRDKLALHGLDDLFDAVVVSYDIGAHKPDRRVFETAVDRLDADECVVVGDSEADVEGARAAGFSAIRLGDTHSATTAAVDDLSDLLALFGDTPLSQRR